MKFFILNPKIKFKKKIGILFDKFYPKEKENKEIFHFQTKKSFLEKKNFGVGMENLTQDHCLSSPKKLLLRTAPKILSIFYKL